MLCLSCGFPNDDGVARCKECGEPPRDPSLPFLPQGTLLYDRAYAVGTGVGVGRFGLTYTATMRGTMQPVVIKELVLKGCGRVGVTLVPRGGWTEDHLDDARQRFLHEGQALARLDHPGLPRIEGTFEESNTAYVVMEHLRGKSLARLLHQRGGKLKEADALEYALKAGEVLEAVHRTGILHGDVKPRNVFLVDPVQARDSSRIVLVDFCTAGRLAGGRGQGSLASSPGYSPPECYPQQVQPGPYTDVYALAAVLYHCLTGTRPPEATARGKGQPLVGVRQVNPWINARVAQAVMRGLETESWRRPQTVAEFMDELRFGRGGVSVPPPRPVDKPGRSSPPPVTTRPLPAPARVPAASSPRDPARSPTPSLQPPRGAPGGPIEKPDPESWPPPLVSSRLDPSRTPRNTGFAPLVYSVKTLARKPVAAGRGTEVSAAPGKRGAPAPTSFATVDGGGAPGGPSPPRQATTPGAGRVRAPAAWAPPVPLVSVVRIPVRGTALSRPRPAQDPAGSASAARASAAGLQVGTGVDPVARRRRFLAWALAVLLALSVSAAVIRGHRRSESGQDSPPPPGTPSPALSWPAHRQAVTTLAFSPDGKQLLSGGQDHTARLWDLESRREAHAFQVAGAVTGIAFSPDGARLATASEDESIRIWTTQGQQVARIRVGDQPATIAFSDDGTSLAGRGHAPLLCVWSATTGQPLSSVELPVPAGVVRFAGGSTRVVSLDPPASTPRDGPAVRISDLASGRSTVAFRYARPQVQPPASSRLPRACLSDDGRIALTRGSAQDAEDWLIAWDVLEGRPIGRGQVRDLEGVLAVSPRGRLALLAVASRTVAWDVITGQEIFRFAEPASAITCGAFSGDGRRFAVGGRDGRIHLGSQ